MILSSISVLLLENRNPVKSLSWILVLVFLPLIGIILYLIIGQNYRKQKIISKKSLRNQTANPSFTFDIQGGENSPLYSNHLQLIRLLHKNNEAQAYPDNKIDIYADGVSTFEAMFEAIESAQNHIHIEFFIFEDDRISNKMRELLVKKAGQGVRVRMIYDYFGSFVLSAKYLTIPMTSNLPKISPAGSGCASAS